MFATIGQTKTCPRKAVGMAPEKRAEFEAFFDGQPRPLPG
jgi:hypothetical protein